MLSSSQFKVGDVVRCTNPASHISRIAHLRKGNLYVITDTDYGTHGGLVNVRLFEDRYSIYSSPLFPAKEFELVK